MTFCSGQYTPLENKQTQKSPHTNWNNHPMIHKLSKPIQLLWAIPCPFFSSAGPAGLLLLCWFLFQPRLSASAAAALSAQASSADPALT